jgi:hypothetical protein
VMLNGGWKLVFGIVTWLSVGREWSYWWSMILSENRHPLFGIML